MTEQPPEDARTAEQGTSPACQAAKPGKTSPLRIVLLVILGVLVVSLAYDRWARNQCDQAYKRLGKLPRELAIAEDVQETIGRGPSGQMQDKGSYMLQTYSWRRGLPWDSYVLYVVYYKVDPPRLKVFTKNEPPVMNDVAAPIIKFSDKALADGPAKQPAEEKPADEEKKKSAG